MTQTDFEGLKLSSKIYLILSIHYSIFKEELKVLPSFVKKIIILLLFLTSLGYAPMAYIIYEEYGLLKAIIITLLSLLISMCIGCGIWLYSIHKHKEEK